MEGSLSLAIPYFYIAHLLLISMRVGAALLFAPLWGHPGIPQPMRVLLVFTISLGIASITPFSPQAYGNPGVVIPSEVLIGLLLSMGIRIAFAGLHMGGTVHQLSPGILSRAGYRSTNAESIDVDVGVPDVFGYMMILTTEQHHNIIRALSASYQAFRSGR
jgi:flagellar biosynthetic protein FliR